MSLLLMREILRMFVNILTADDKYFLGYRENLPQTIVMQLSNKQKNYFQFIAAFLKFHADFSSVSLVLAC